jgi:hypothetical protein
LDRQVQGGPFAREARIAVQAGRILVLVAGWLVWGLSAHAQPSDKEAAPGGVATIRWIVTDTPGEDCAALQRGKKTLFVSRGCSIWNDRNAVRECSIIAPMPRDENDYARMTTLGHEFWHCLYGKWHDDYGNAYPSAWRSRVLRKPEQITALAREEHLKASQERTSAHDLSFDLQDNPEVRYWSDEFGLYEDHDHKPHASHDHR